MSAHSNSPLPLSLKDDFGAPQVDLEASIVSSYDPLAGSASRSDAEQEACEVARVKEGSDEMGVAGAFACRLLRPRWNSSGRT